MATTVVPVSGDVQGNITDCKIETAQKSVDRRSGLAFSQHETYITYDVCTKQQITQYTTASLTGLGFITVVIIIGIVILVMLGIFGAITDN